MLRYFAYGSNLSTPRLLARVPTARKLGVATLAAHRLVFHKIGRDGSAKCDALHTGQADDRVHGVLFELPVRDRLLLDRAEGLGNGYEQRDVAVILQDDSVWNAYTYIATRRDAALLPFDWYLEHVLRGAREHGLPRDYVASIGCIATCRDPDRGRRARELGIYGQRPGCSGREPAQPAGVDGVRHLLGVADAPLQSGAHFVQRLHGT